MLVAILLSGLLLASAQMTWPLVGQNLPPSGQVTTVAVDYLVDSIETINSEANSWTGHVWFHMQWTDPNAQAAIQNATNTWINGGTCNKACDWTMHQSAGCCDSLFVPHIDIPNVVAIKQESFPMYRFWLKGSDPSVVHWSQRISADFHSPFDFRAWPFEHQHLLVELQIPPSIADRVTLVFGEATHLQNTPHTKGEVVTGWHIKSITRRMYDPSGCYNVSKANSTFFSIQPNNLSAGAVLSPLAYNTWAQLRQNDLKIDSYTTLQDPDCQLVGTGNTAEGLAQYGPRYLVIDTMVQRARNYYVLANLTPLILLAYMVFVTYAMERSDLEARMGVIVTLVLAVSALQFTYNFPPASYINTVQQITLMSYVLYFIVAIESMVTAQICRMHMRRRQHDQLVSVAHAPSLNTLGSGSLNNMKLPTTFEEVVEQATTNSNNQPRKSSGSGNIIPSVIVRPAVKGTPITLGVEQVPARTSLGGTVPGRPGPVAEGWSWCGDEANKDLEQPVSTSYSGQESPDRASSSGVELKQRTSANKPARLAVPELSVPLPSAEAGSAGGAGAARGSGGRSKWFPLTTSIMAGLKGGNQSVNNFGRTMSMHMNAFTERTSAVRDRITKDEAFAQLFASRMDNICCWSLLVGYTVTLAVLLWVNSQVGDHKLMLAGATKPANM